MMKTGQYQKTLHRILTLALMGLSLFHTHITSVQAEVELPNGNYHTTINDLEVKVMGGSVKVQRTWYQGKWHINRAWNPLLINHLGLGIEGNYLPDLHRIDRNNDIYRHGGGKTATLFNSTEKLKTQTISGYDSANLTQPLTDDEFRNLYKDGGASRARLRYIWEDREGNKIIYNLGGRILEYRDRNDVKVTFSYDSNGKMIGVHDHFGTQVLWYEYDPVSGEIANIRDHVDPLQARQVKYHYVAKTHGYQLSTVTDVRDYSWSYGYNVDKLRLTSITDPEGRITSISHKNGRVEKVTNPDGTSISYEYDYDKTKKEFFTRRTYISGKILEVWYNNDGEIIRRDQNGVTIEKVQIEGRVYTHTNELGHQTIRDYDEWDNLIKITHPDKSFRTYKYDPKYSNLLEENNELGVKTKYDYDANGNRIRMTEALELPEQRITEYTTDTYGNTLEVKRLGDAVSEESITSYTYDNFGDIKTKTQSVSAIESHTINYDIYDRMGNLREWRDGRGKVWKQTFDEKGNRTSITDPLIHMTSYEYDGFGNLTKLIDANNKATQYAYNVKNQLETIINPLLAEKRYIYNNMGQLTTFYDEENHPIYFGYDGQGRIQKVQDGAGNTFIVKYGVIKDRNVRLNQLTAITFPTFSQEYSYDNRGRLTHTIDVLDTNTKNVNQRQYDIAGRLISITDAELKITRYDYDNLGHEIKTTHPDDTTNIYSYDNRDNLLSVTNEKQITIRTYSYDLKNRLKTETWATGEFHQYNYNYDENNNPIIKIDAKGQVVKYHFDDANRLDLVNYFIDISAITPSKTVSFSYNMLNQLIGYDDGTTSATYTLDDLQRKTSETINYGDFSKTISTSYYKNGLQKTFTDPSNLTTTYNYDNANRLSQLSLPGEGAILYNQYTWLAPSTITYPGGATRTVKYDPVMRIQHISLWDPAKNSLMDYIYEYDKIGNIKSKTTEHGVYDYDYDQRDRLISTTNPTQTDEVFTYDDAGNRLNDLTYTDNWTYTASNQLKSFGDITLDYDANGSPIARTQSNIVTNYEYDLENRLSSIKDATNTTIANYYYDPFGRRLWKNIGGVRTYFMYATEGLIAEMDDAGTITQSYGYTPGSSYGTSPLYTRTTNGFAYYQLDHLGTPQQLIDKAGQVVWRGKTLAFGEMNIDIELVENKFRFAGQYFDNESKLHYNYYRYYNPKTGRYITSDPIGLAGGINSYEYVGANPIRFIDNYGLVAIEPLPDPTPTQNPNPKPNPEKYPPVANDPEYNTGPGTLVRIAKGIAAVCSTSPQACLALILMAVSEPADAPELNGSDFPLFSAANDPNYDDPDSCPPCDEWRLQLNKAYHAIEKMAKNASTPEQKLAVKKNREYFKFLVKAYEKQCGKYTPPPDFDDVYQR